MRREGEPTKSSNPLGGRREDRISMRGIVNNLESAPSVQGKAQRIAFGKDEFQSCALDVRTTIEIVGPDKISQAVC